jgi:hypothetical protein
MAVDAVSVLCCGADGVLRTSKRRWKVESNPRLLIWQMR